MTKSERKSRDEIEQIEQETGVYYDIENNTVSYTAEKNDTSHFVDFIEYLFDEGYITKEDIPYTPGYGKIRYLLNSNKSHQDGREMTRPENVSEGVYLETNHDSESKIRYTKQVFDDFVFE